MATRGKGEGSIYKRTDGRWAASIELPPALDGRRRRKVITSKSKADLVTKMRALQREARESGDLATSSPTLKDWMAYYLDHIAADRVRPQTLTSYQASSQNYIVPILGRKRLDKVTPQDVLAMTRQIQSTPKDPDLRTKAVVPPGTVMLSSTTALNAHNVLSGAYKAALQLGKVTRNPCTNAPKPTKRHTQERALTAAEAVTLLRYVADKPDGALWATFLLTGCRSGEVLGLEIDRCQGGILDLSWQLQELTNIDTAPPDFEHRHITGNMYLTRPKTSSGWRSQPLVEPLASILERHIGDRTDGLVFLRPSGKPWRHDRAYRRWKEILKAANLPTDVKLHGTRHTLVDLLYEAGVPEQVIMEIVGHSTRAVTRGYRTRGSDALKSSALTSVSRLLGLDT